MTDTGDVGRALVSTCLDLLGIPSLTGGEAALCDHVQARLGRRFGPGGVVRTGDSVVAGDLAADGGDDGRPLLLLLGHLDTVPGDPAPGRVAGDRIHGLGASDMKGGLAVMLELADRLPRDAPVRTAFAFYACEETDYDRSGLPALLDAVPALREAALGLCLEPTDGELHLGCVGSLHARLTVRGRPAHAARPWQGENAIYKALPLLSDLAAVAPRDVERGGLTFREVTTVTRADASGGRNVVPGRLDLNVNVRFAPGRTAEAAEADLRALVGGRAEVEVVDRAPSGDVPTGNPLLSRLAASVPVRPKQAWTDVARLDAAGIPAANFGPGATAQAHQPGEWCGIQALLLAYARLHALVCGP